VAGHNETLDSWVGERYGRAYRTAVIICGNRADAEEAVQDAFLRVWRFRDALPDDARRNAWLYRVLVNACYSKLRQEVPRRDRERERLGPDADIHASTDAPDLAAERSEIADALDSTLRDLPEALRVVVVLRYYSDLSEREIGKTQLFLEYRATPLDLLFGVAEFSANGFVFHLSLVAPQPATGSRRSRKAVQEAIASRPRQNARDPERRSAFEGFWRPAL